MRIFIRLTLFFLFLSSTSFAQEIVLRLNPLKEHRFNTNYKIAEVLDFRGGSPEKMGEAYYSRSAKAPILFQKDLADLILARFQSEIEVADSVQREIQVRLEVLNVWERYNPTTKLYEGRLEVKFGFYLLGDIDPIFLVNYQNRIIYQRSLNGINQLQDLVVQYMDEAFSYFDNWIKTKGLEHRLLADEVELRMVDLLHEATEDTVFYNPARALNWQDFRATPDFLSRNNAVINTSFSIQGNAVLQAGTILQTLEFKVYMLQNQSWVKKPDEYALNHEQRHFDIVRIVVDRLKARLYTMELTPANFQAKLNEVFFDSYREMNKIQEAYDQQCGNGINRELQEKWNMWIQEALEGDWTNLVKAVTKE